MTADARTDVRPAAAARVRGGRVVAALCFSMMTLAILQAAVVPVIPTMARQLDIGPTAVGWVLTANLLAAAVTTPVLGRLADQRGGRPVLIGTLVVVVIGSVLCVLAPSLPLLIAGRVLQGTAFALFPVGVAVVRAILDERRLAHAIGLMSGIMAAGGGVGMVAAGVLVAGGGEYRRVFWMLLALSLIALVVTWLAIPGTGRSELDGGRFDAMGAVLLAVGLCAVLLAIAEGDRWGIAPALLSAVGGLGCLLGWYRHEKQCATPLVPPPSLIGWAVTPAHVAAVLVGAAMYVQFLGIAQFVQVDADLGGYGFGVTVLEASLLFLLPGSVAGVLSAAVSGRLIHRFRADRVLTAMCAVGVAGFGVLIVAHDKPWQMVVAAVVVNVFVSGAYAALPSLLVGAVPAADTAVVNGVNAIARIFGSSLASATIASLLAATTVPGTDVASESAYVLAFWIGAAAAAGAGVVGMSTHRMSKNKI
ncbi:MFS transporter [Rhodococcus sp. NPDC003318]|uniref:MFS transporter n=1 Tax=Rhodococcus sp. NPDC003318 TaxID=3364503 RepID=UPI0036D0DCF7